MQINYLILWFCVFSHLTEVLRIPYVVFNDVSPYVPTDCFSSV